MAGDLGEGMNRITTARVAPKEAVFRPALLSFPFAGFLPEEIMAKRSKKMQKMLAEMCGPVDAKLFMYCSEIYGAAAHMSMPVENPSFKKFKVGESFIALTDIPVNRGMLAVTKELRELKVSDQVKAAMVSRLLHFGEIFEHAECKPWIKESSEQGSVMVSECLMRACAEAKINVTNDRLRLDIPDLVRLAEQYEAEEDKPN